MNVSPREIALILIAIGLPLNSYAIGPSSAHEAIPQKKAENVSPESLRPSWVQRRTGESNYSTYLSDWDKKYLDSDYRDFNESILSKDEILRMRREVDTMFTEYENREAHDLNSQVDQQNYVERRQAYSMHVIANVAKFQFEHRLKKAETHSDGVRTFNKVRRVTGKIAKGDVAASPGFGEFLNLSFGTRMDIIRKWGQLWANSGILNFKLESWFGRPLVPYDPWTLEAINMGDPAEQYIFTTFRRVPLTDIQASVSYGGTSTNLTYALSKKLTNNLTLEGSHVRPVNSSRSATRPEGEQIVKLIYSIRF